MPDMEEARDFCGFECVVTSFRCFHREYPCSDNINKTIEQVICVSIVNMLLYGYSMIISFFGARSKCPWSPKLTRISPKREAILSLHMIVRASAAPKALQPIMT